MNDWRTLATGLIAGLLLTVSARTGVAGDSTNFFTRAHLGTRNDFTGHVGYEFVPNADIRLTALGRPVGGPLARNHDVTLWNVVSRRPLARVTVSPLSTVDARGFALEPLVAPISLKKGRAYRLTTFEAAGSDPFADIAELRDHVDVATVVSGVYAVGDTYPAARYGGANQGYGVPTFLFDLLPPQPFCRDLATGYLLNYAFMSPRPYCWSGEDSLLSGWEVDRAGGHYEFHPTCRYPAGFAFHSDWFKLVDTRTNAAVTLTHQLARQSEGRVTLEFRFRLPMRMDGVCWQLRDLERAGVGIETRGTNLCWETGQVLMPYEVNRDYGIKVDADIVAKQADVYVDGRLKVQGLPFVHPLKTIDSFLVKTGGAATGELYLNPVNIHKGYAVNETFVTCGVGSVPADWAVRAAGGHVSVEAFECGTKPDVFSLRLSGRSGRGSVLPVASKSFLPIAAKTVFEYRFLMAGGFDRAIATLGNGGRPGVGMEMSREGICCFDGADERVPLVRECRSNFWYMVKVVSDPGIGTADIWVNGKPVASGVACHGRAKAYDTLKFGLVGAGTASVLWVDDVKVYPWRDYPVDYVPEPKPVQASHLLGVQSCNLWREGTAYAGWDYVLPYRDKREPYLGWYDEGNPEETDWEIKWQVEHGIAFEQHCWYRPNNAINQPIKDGVLDQGIIQGLFNARYSHLKKFTIMCTNEGACETNPQDWRDHIVPYWIEYFFKDPRYLKLDGKPVLSIYHLGNWLRTFGGREGARMAIQTLRDEVAAAGFPGIILMMEHRGADRNVLQSMQSIGVDCCYAYTWGTPDTERQREGNLAQRDAAAGCVQMLPSISMGWDRQAWGVRDGGWTAVDDYRVLARWTRDEFMRSLPEHSLGRRVVMLANWNEFGEGHFLMPSTLAGFGYLDALRAVFTEGSAHRDSRPTARQKRRFTVLYPQE